jgi:hypothetical protein
LELEHHHVLLDESHLGGGEVEFPHANEAPVKEPLDGLAMGEETREARNVFA